MIAFRGEFARFKSVRLYVLAIIITGILVSIGCKSGVSYVDNGMGLVVENNNAFLSYKDITIGDDRKVNTILLRKGSGNLVRVSYFKFCESSILSIFEDDFDIYVFNGCISISSANEVSLDEGYLKCDFIRRHDDCGQINIEKVRKGRITYSLSRDGEHIIWIDADFQSGYKVFIPLSIRATSNKEDVLLRVKEWKDCYYTIQNNLYEFGTF